jgi:hypothetical protein
LGGVSLSVRGSAPDCGGRCAEARRDDRDRFIGEMERTFCQHDVSFGDDYQ